MSPACQPCFRQPTTEITKKRNEIKLKSEQSEFGFLFFFLNIVSAYMGCYKMWLNICCLLAKAKW